MFLSIAGLLNIYNWIYFTVSLKTIFESRKLFKKKIKKIANRTFIPSILLILILFCIGCAWSCAIPDKEKGKPDKNEDNKPLLQYMSTFTSLLYLMLGISFGLAGKFLYSEVTLRNFGEGLPMK